MYLIARNQETEMTKEHAIQSARTESERTSETVVAWWRYSTNEYRVDTHDEYLEIATLADEIVSGFESGERVL